MTEQEWRDKVIATSMEKVIELQPELMKQAEDSVKAYGIHQMKLDLMQAAKIAQAVNEIQEHAFLLGMRTGMHLLMNVLKEVQGDSKHEATPTNPTTA